MPGPNGSLPEYSLGEMLIQFCGLSRAQVAEAALYARTNSDLMIGESCVRLEMIDRTQLETMLLRQEAMRNDGAKSLARLAILRTKEAAKRIDACTQVGWDLAVRLVR